MRRTYKSRMTAWAMVIAMVMTLVTIPGFAANERNVNELVDLELTVRQDGKVIAVGEKIRYEDSFSIDLSFKVPEKAGGGLEIGLNDYVEFEMPSIINSSPMKLKSFDIESDDEIDVATAVFVGDRLRITFDNPDVFGEDSQYIEATCTLTANFEYRGTNIDDGDEVRDVLIFGKSFTFVPTQPTYVITKSGTQNGGEIEWEVMVESKKQTNTPIDGSLKGIIFKDELEGVGKYIGGSFEVIGDDVSGVFTEPSEDDQAIIYVFPDNATGNHIIKFKTEVPIDTLINGGNITNTGKLYGGNPLSTTPINTADKTISINAPIWILKEGSINKNQNDAGYEPTGRLITWSIGCQIRTPKSLGLLRC